MNILTYIIVFVTSFFAGFMGGQVGGGGLILLPMLLLVGLNPLVALGTSRFSGIFLNVVGTWQHLRHHKIPTNHVLLFGIMSLLGSLGGSLLVFYLPIDMENLKKIIIAVLFLILVIVFFSQKLGQIDNDLHPSKKHYVLLSIMVFLIGIYGGVIGVAMTTFFMMLFTFYKQSYLQSMAYAILLSLIASIIATIIFMYYGSVDYTLGILQGIGGGIGTYFGSRFIIKKGNLWLKYILAVVILITLGKMGWDLF
ncbi:MAG: sulfite exporter TauE/SafE family protein [Candidatus Gracilibacteria bacterium]|jgi:hypothetical protein